MFKQYVKNHEMTMMIEYKNILKSISSSNQLTTPFLTNIYQCQNKNMDLLEYVLHFNKCMSQLIKDKETIISIIQETDEIFKGDINNMWALSSLRDLSLFVLSLNLVSKKKLLVKSIMNHYNL